MSTRFYVALLIPLVRIVLDRNGLFRINLLRLARGRVDVGQLETGGDRGLHVLREGEVGGMFGDLAVRQLKLVVCEAGERLAVLIPLCLADLCAVTPEKVA